MADKKSHKKIKRVKAEPKLHYRMDKSNKRWMYAGLSTLSILAPGGLMTAITAEMSGALADTATIPATSIASTAASVSSNPVASDPDAGRSDFEQSLTNQTSKTSSSVTVQTPEQVANKADYKAAAQAASTYALVNSWTDLTTAWNNPNITYIELGSDITNTTTGVPLDQTITASNNANLGPRTQSIILDGANHALDLGNNVSIALGQVTATNNSNPDLTGPLQSAKMNPNVPANAGIFTLTDVVLTQTSADYSASSGSARSVIMVPYVSRSTLDGTWEVNLNNVTQNPTLASWTIANGYGANWNNRGGGPPRLVDLEDGLLTVSGTLQWNSQAEMLTIGALNIANGGSISYQTSSNNSNDAGIYFMAYDHQNTIHDTGANHGVVAGDNVTINLTKPSATSDYSPFWGDYGYFLTGDNFNANYSGYGKYISAYTFWGNINGAESVSNSSEQSLSMNKAWFEKTFQTTMNSEFATGNASVSNAWYQFGANSTINAPNIGIGYPTFDGRDNWGSGDTFHMVFGPNSTLQVNQKNNSSVFYLTNDQSIRFISPKSLTIYNDNGSATSTSVFALANTSKVTLTNSSINVWNNRAFSNSPTQSGTAFQTFTASNTQASRQSIIQVIV